MRLFKMLLPFIVLAGLIALAWPRASGRGGDELVIISPHWEGIQEEFGHAFADHWKAKTGREMRVVWLDLGGGSKCTRYIRSKAPGAVGADIFFGGGVDNYLGLTAVEQPGSKEKVSYLAPVELSPEDQAAMPATLAGYPLRDPGNRWFSACLSNFGICYNRPVLRERGLPEPAEWEDLAHPGFFNLVGSGEPRSSAVVHMVFELIFQSQGWESGWATVTRMAANSRSFTEGSNGIPRDVAMGQFAAGGTIDFYAQDKVQRLGGENMGFVVPRRLLVVNGDPIAALAGAPHAEAAAEFVRFVLSERGQKVWCQKPGTPSGPAKFWLGRLPVRPGMYSSVPAEIAQANPFEMQGVGTYQVAKASKRWGVLNDLLGATVVDAHEELRGAWKALIDAGLPPEGLAELAKPPCSEAELLAIADRLRNAPIAEKNEQTAQWSAWARAKYAGIKKRWGK